MDVLIAIGIILGIFTGLLVIMECGRMLGKRRLLADPEGFTASAAMEGAIFALLGLLIAFTFSGAAARFDTRRGQVIDEANAVGTAYLRIDLLPLEYQPHMRELFRSYVDARLAVFEKMPDVNAAQVEINRSTELQGKIWELAMSSARISGSQPVAMLMLPALNQMFDIAATRNHARLIHPPVIVYALLLLLAIGCAFLAGNDLARAKKSSQFYMVCFAGVMAISLYVIFDLEYPRIGLIRLDHADSILAEVRASMK